MKKLLLASFLFVAYKYSFGQEAGSKSHFNLVIGPSIPIGKFASTDDFTRKAGFAKTGEFLKLSVTHLIKNNFGISAQLQFQRNPFNTTALENSIAKTGSLSLSGVVFSDSIIIPRPGQQPVPNDPYHNWQVEKTAWYAGTLMVGGFAEFSLSANKKWSAVVAANLGFVYASSPRIHAQSITDTSQVVIKQESKSAPGMSYSLTPALYYSLNARTRVTFNIEYFGTTKITYSKVKTTEFGRRGASGQFPSPSMAWNSQTIADMKQSISSINVGIGISFGI